MKKKIKVVHICDKFGVEDSSVHGVSRLFSWWFPRFDQDNFDVRLIGLRKSDQACENLKQQGIDILSLNKGKFDFSTISEIIQLIKRWRTDILHLHGYGATNFGRVAARFTKTKNIVHEHLVDVNMPRYQIPCDYFLSKWTDIGIANCNAVKEFMAESRFVPRNLVNVVYNGVPIKDFKPAEKNIVASERERWKIPDDYKIVASIGRLDKQKGNKYFIEAAARLLRQKRIKIKFMIVGDGPLLDTLIKQCGELGIESDFIFTGYHRNVPTILSMIDTLVIPSLWEGTTLTVFEAMAMQKCIVSTDVDGLGEVLEHGKNALVVPSKNKEMLAEAIENVLLDLDLRNKLAKRAFEDSQIFDIGNTVRSIQNIYLDILGLS